MILITHVSFNNGNNHHNITHYRWLNTSTNETGRSSRSQMIDFINKNPAKVFVKDPKGTIEVFVINDNPPYLRTKADGRPTNNLINLPTF